MINDSGGYQTNPFVARLYNQVIPYRERPDVDFFVEAARESGGPVLEVGCGTGRVLIPTARAGISITGLDLSRNMLDVCRKGLKDEPLEVREQVRLVEADMREFELHESFRLATLPFRPFQHLLTVEDQISCIQIIHRHLIPGGKIILDLFNPSLEHLTRDDLGQEVGAEPEFITPEGIRVRRFNKTISRDYHNQINQVELIYYLTHPDRKKERIVHAFPMRYLFRFEAEHLLVRSGFKMEAVYGDYQKTPFGEQYPGELILVARKKEQD
jgi:SAM-dependent methyltransferase